MSYNFTNQAIANLLKEIASAYEIKGENRFRIRAYQDAADAIEHESNAVKDLWDEGKLDLIPGIGEHITNYLNELFSSGKVKHFEQVKKEFPSGMFKLLQIPNIGPKTAYKIAKEFKIKDVEDLKKLAVAKKLQSIEGFSSKKEEQILKSIEEFKMREDRILLPEAEKVAGEFIEHLSRLKFVERIDPLGSLRRRVATIGDIDLAVASEQPAKVVDAFCNLPIVKRVIEAGENTATITSQQNRRVDLMVQPLKRYGSLLQHFTGSKHHNIHLRKLALEKGLSLSEYGIKKIKNHLPVVLTPALQAGNSKPKDLDRKGHQFSEDMLFECTSEEEFYKRLGMDFIPPELREDKGEIEAAQRHKIPKLLELKDIQGEFHVHTNLNIGSSHDIGENDIQSLAKKGNQLSYKYLGISDHNPAVTTHTDSEITKILKGRSAIIEKVSSSLDYIEIINCLEVDVLADGRVALTDKQLTIQTINEAGIHSSHSQGKSKITQRIMNALENPLIHMLSHPTGRLLQKREAYEADWNKIFQFCADNHKVLEINASPERLDLPDFMILKAKECGVKFAINTDAHKVLAMENIKYGVDTARRGWCTKDDIINTWPLKKVLEYLKIS